MAANLGQAERGEKRIPESRPSAFAAFRYRDFRLLWAGLLISQMGYWMQFTSLTYLVGNVLNHSAASGALGLGLLGLVRSIPFLILAPVSGVVADRYPRRTVLILVN